MLFKTVTALASHVLLSVFATNSGFGSLYIATISNGLLVIIEEPPNARSVTFFLLSVINIFLSSSYK